MCTAIIATTSNIIAIVAAFIAALFWYKSAIVKISPRESGTGNPEIIVDGYAFISTVEAQSILSRKAAFAAALAALFQSFGLIASIISQNV